MFHPHQLAEVGPHGAGPEDSQHIPVFGTEGPEGRRTVAPSRLIRHPATRQVLGESAELHVHRCVEVVNGYILSLPGALPHEQGRHDGIGYQHPADMVAGRERQHLRSAAGVSNDADDTRHSLAPHIAAGSVGDGAGLAVTVEGTVNNLWINFMLFYYYIF